MKKTLAILMAFIMLIGNLTAFATSADIVWTINPTDAYYATHNIKYIDGLGLILTDNNDKNGVVDKTGKVIIPFEHDYLDAINADYLLTCRDGMWGIIDKNGNLTVPYTYDYLNPGYSENFVVAGKQQNGEEKTGIIDTKGNVIIALGTYDEVVNISDELFCARNNGKVGVVNKSGKVVIPFTKEGGIYMLNDNYLYCSQYDNGLEIYDLNGKVLFSDKTVAHIEKAGEYFVLYKDTGKEEYEISFIDKDLKPADTKGYEISEFSDEYFVARKKNDASEKLGLVDKNFNQVLPLEYDDIRKIHDEMLVVSKDGEEGHYINTKGERLTAFDKYEEIDYLTDGYIAAYKTQEGNEYETLCGIVDTNGNVVVDFAFESISYCGYGVFALVSKSYRVGFAEIGTGNKVTGYIDGIVLQIGNKNAKVFGGDAITDVAPIIKNSSTMLPARFVAENLGAEVKWDPNLRQVKIIPADESLGEIIMTIGSKTATVGGEVKTLHTAPFIEGGRTYTPVRFIAESLACDVKWIPETRTVEVIVK